MAEKAKDRKVNDEVLKQKFEQAAVAITEIAEIGLEDGWGLDANLVEFAADLTRLYGLLIQTEDRFFLRAFEDPDIPKVGSSCYVRERYEKTDLIRLLRETVEATGYPPNTEDMTWSFGIDIDGTLNT